MHKSYPKYKYHKTLEPKVVDTEEQDEALGEEWKESPAHHFEVAEVSVPLHEEQDEQEEQVEMTLEELQKACLEHGYSKKAIKDKDREQLIEMLEAE